MAYFETLNLLRLLLATLVLLGHCYALSTGNDLSDPVYRFSNGQTPLSWVAVDLFFVLSGYLITRSWQNDPHPGRFLEKRIRRLYPGFLCASLLGILTVAGFAGAAILPELKLRSLAALLILKRWDSTLAFPHNALHTTNASLWTIRFEGLCYLLTLFLGLSRRLGNRRWTLLLFAVAYGTRLAAYHCPSDRAGVWYYVDNMVRFVPLYLAGAVAWHWESILDRLPIRWAALIGSTALLVACKAPSGYLILAPFSLVLLLSAARRTRSPVNLQGIDLSYGVYLYGSMIQQFLLHLFGTLPLFVFFPASCLLSAIVAAASWKWIERPALSFGRKFPAADKKTSKAA